MMGEIQSVCFNLQLLDTANQSKNGETWYREVLFCVGVIWWTIIKNTYNDACHDFAITNFHMPLSIYVIIYTGFVWNKF